MLTKITLAPALGTLALLAGILLATPSAYAQTFTVVDNLSQSTTDVSGASQTLLAGQFIRTGGTAGILQSITLPLNTTGRSSTISLTVRAYNSTSFGSILTTLASQTVRATTPTNTTFVPTATFALAPNTSYWVVARLTAGSDFNWSYTSPFTTSGEGSLANNPTNVFSVDGGASFQQSYNTEPQKIRVLASAASVVPEANTAALLGLALPLVALAHASVRCNRIGAVALARRRKKI